jgi:hypothetical protein
MVPTIWPGSINSIISTRSLQNLSRLFISSVQPIHFIVVCWTNSLSVVT